MEASDSLWQKKIKFFCPILDTSTRLQTYILHQYSENWHICEDSSIFDGAFRHSNNAKCVYAHWI